MLRMPQGISFTGVFRPGFGTLQFAPRDPDEPGFGTFGTLQAMATAANRSKDEAKHEACEERDEDGSWELLDGQSDSAATTIQVQLETRAKAKDREVRPPLDREMRRRERKELYALLQDLKKDRWDESLPPQLQEGPQDGTSAPAPRSATPAKEILPYSYEAMLCYGAGTQPFKVPRGEEEAASDEHDDEKAKISTNVSIQGGNMREFMGYNYRWFCKEDAVFEEYLRSNDGSGRTRFEAQVAPLRQDADDDPAGASKRAKKGPDKGNGAKNDEPRL